MRVVRPLTPPAEAARGRWWDADTESIREDVASRLAEGRGARAVVDPQFPADVKAAGLGD
jgi:hypothetical protein